jgi:hypothetical protein
MFNGPGTSSYLTLSCAAYIPSTATHVILNVNAPGNAFYINFRKDITSQSIYTTGSAVYMSAGGLRAPYSNTTLIMPIDAFKTFQYIYGCLVCPATGSLYIDLIGYY